MPAHLSFCFHTRAYWLFIASEYEQTAHLSLVCLLIVFSFSSLPNNGKTVVKIDIFFAKNLTFSLEKTLGLTPTRPS